MLAQRAVSRRPSLDARSGGLIRAIPGQSQRVSLEELFSRSLAALLDDPFEHPAQGSIRVIDVRAVEVPLGRNGFTAARYVKGVL